MSVPLKRFVSIDIFRAVIMFLMIFVNEISTVKNIPLWLHHAKANEDSMGLADFIFPAFIFITGLSIPLAINARIKRNDSDYEICSYIVMRSVALIIIGFYQVNLEEYATLAFPKAAWALIVTTSFFFIWLNYSKTFNKIIKYTLITTGILLLISMALVYKSYNSSSIISMQPLWWGIIGIIGWSYLTCAIIYYIFKKSFNTLLIIFILFASINIAFHTGVLNNKLWLIDDASYVTLCIGGVLCTMQYIKKENKLKLKKTWLVLACSAVLLILIGFFLRPYAGGISKINSTPAWVFICLGLSVILFEFFIYTIDKLQKKDLYKIIRPAGTSSLTCYMMPYFLVYTMELFHLKYPEFLNEGIGGILRGLGISFILIWIVGQMEKKNLTLKI